MAATLLGHERRLERAAGDGVAGSWPARRPSAAATAIDSASAAVTVTTNVLVASFSRDPAPASPSQSVREPIASSTGASTVAGVLGSRREHDERALLGGLPGALHRRVDVAQTRARAATSASRSAPSTPTVLVCSRTAPGDQPPPASRSTSSTVAASHSIVITTSASRTASATVPRTTDTPTLGQRRGPRRACGSTRQVSRAGGGEVAGHAGPHGPGAEHADARTERDGIDGVGSRCIRSCQHVYQRRRRHDHRRHPPDGRAPRPGRSPPGCASAAGSSTGAGPRLDVLNPATGDVLAVADSADAADVEEVVRVAQETFDSGVWSRMPIHERSRSCTASPTGSPSG